MRFFRHDGIYRSDAGNKPLKPGGGYRLPLVGPEPQSKGATGGTTAPCSSASSAMSSGRLFLDRVARQHCPSPLHRPLHPKTVPGWGTMRKQRTVNSVLTVCLSKRGSRSYVFRCADTGDKPHSAMIEDWELGVLYRKEVERLGDEQAAIASVRKKFFDEICHPSRDTRFFMGTVFPYNTWVVIGVFWPPKGVQESLFD